MITRENLLAACKLEPNWGTHFVTTTSAPGWITSGEFAALTDLAPPDIVSESTQDGLASAFAGNVAAWRSGADREPVTEDRSLRVAGKPGRAEVSTPCQSCLGSGECNGCACGRRHDCGPCDGIGHDVQDPGVAEQKGRSVYRSADGEWTFIADKLAHLLDGYALFRWSGEKGRFNDESPECRRRLMPILGVDTDGTVRVCVMPMRATEKEIEPDDEVMSMINNLAERHP